MFAFLFVIIFTVFLFSASGDFDFSANQFVVSELDEDEPLLIFFGVGCAFDSF